MIARARASRWIVRGAGRARRGQSGPRACTFFLPNGCHGFLVLGAVFLVVTGGEALYADMGHFGRRPIRARLVRARAAGAAAQLLRPGRAAAATIPTAAESRSTCSRRAGRCYPLVVLATVAAVIASQALISGAFSLTQQAMQLGYCPRLDIRHTSAHEMGQIYMPEVNWALMICDDRRWCSASGSSSALAAAYGIAVTATMVITTLLAYVVARRRGACAAGRRLAHRVLPARSTSRSSAPT